MFGLLYQLCHNGKYDRNRAIQDAADYPAGECNPEVGGKAKYQQGHNCARPTKEEHGFSANSI